jgi:integrase
MPAAANKRKLTALMVTKLAPAAHRLLLWDTVQRGLVLVIEPTGYRAFKLIYNHRNRTRWYHIAAADAISLADARHRAAELMLEVIRGRDPQADKRTERGAGTFADLAEEYLNQYAKKHNKSWKQAATLISRNVLPRLGKLPADGITRADVKALMRSIEAPITANQTLAAVSAIFSWATKEEILSANPCKLVERNETKDRERVLSISEIKLVWAEFGEDMISTALKLILLLGQRPGEVSHMRYEHLKDGWWEMPGAACEGWPGTKNGGNHRIWINKPAKALIEASVTERSGYVLTGVRGNAVSNLDLAMRNICSKLKIERATPHDLRRTAGSAITALGHGRNAMDRILNHKSRTIASVYDRHSYSAEDQRIMENVGSHIMGLVLGAAANVVAFTQQR